jgi:hypothetical protein
MLMHIPQLLHWDLSVLNLKYFWCRSIAESLNPPIEIKYIISEKNGTLPQLVVPSINASAYFSAFSSPFLILRSFVFFILYIKDVYRHYDFTSSDRLVSFLFQYTAKRTNQSSRITPQCINHKYFSSLYMG